MYYTLGILFVSLGLACSRDTSKAFRSMPAAISNSLVNLGKMDISFHFNRNPSDNLPSSFKPESFMHNANQIFLPRQEPVLQQTIEVERSYEPCPCSSFKDFKNPFVKNSPTDMLGKILRSNDLFTYNQEPVVSTTCCDSHEHVEEDTVFFDISPKNTHAETPSVHPPMPSFPLMLDAILPKLQSAATNNIKPKAIEIFFFPKNKDIFLENSFRLFPAKDKKIKKSEIQIVGDKDLRNEFKSLKYRPSMPIFGNKETNLLTNQRTKMDKKEDKKDMKMYVKQESTKEVVKEEVKEKTTPGPFTASPANIII